MIGLPDLIGIAPLALLVLAAIVVITMDIFMSRGDDREVMPMTSAGAMVGAGVLLALLWGKASADGSYGVFGDQLIIDQFGLLGAFICLAAGLVSILMSPRYLERCGLEFGEYYGLMLFALVGMLLMCMSQDLVTLFLALETMSLAIYGLVGMNKNDPRGAEASVKYFVMGAVASGFLTLGIAMVYMASGTTNIAEVAGGIAGSWEQGGNYIAVVGAGLLVIGFGFKIGAAPFHAWTPDVYEGAPTPITGFMASAVKVAAGVVFARILFSGLSGTIELTETEGQQFLALQSTWRDVVAIIAALSLLIGGLVALVQHNIKRMLGYSAVAHSGFMLLAFLSRPDGTTDVMSLAVYLAGYAAAAAGIFGVLAQLTHDGKDATDIDHIQGLAKKRPVLALALGLFMLSLAGIPGTAGFIGKLLVFQEAVSGGYSMLVLFAVIMSVVSLGYYLSIIVSMYMRPALREFVHEDREWGADAAVFVCSATTLLLGLFPQQFIELAMSASRQFHS